MSRHLTTRLAARPLLQYTQPAVCTSSFVCSRAFTQGRALRDEADSSKPPARPRSESLLDSIYGSSQGSNASPKPSDAMANLSQSMVFQSLGKSSIDTSALLGGAPGQRTVSPQKEDDLEPYHLHVYSHKHNTHVTCTKPNREPIISMSCGNIGYKKSRRGTFDSAYSLTKYVLERLVHTGWPPKIHRLELVMRGFGQGRDAAMKVLMSPEGKILRDKIVRVADSTRIKFGGTRSKAPRRLG